MKTDPVLDYIESNFDRSIYQDANGSGFMGIDLPYPYSSPCIKGEGKFFFFFYWDTAFTNFGLLRTGRVQTAKDNIRNMLWLIKRYGYMPNHVGITNRSQPPYLCMMVRDYFAHIGGREADSAFYEECAEGLRQEYHFWITGRHTRTGLQRHGEHETAEGCIKFYHNKRVLAQGNAEDVSDAVKRVVGGHFLAEAETGWDFNQRFDARCNDHNAVDLNGLLYSYELWLEEASQALGWGEESIWQARAADRRERVNRYLWNEAKGWFYDYDFVNEKQSEVRSLAGMLPLFSGLASKEQAARVAASIHELEGEYGVAVTDDRPGCRNYQWAFPNAWPPLTYVTVEALRRNGEEAAAKRIAKKHLAVTRALFAKTGQLWEKTEVDTGAVAGGEYDAAPMIGWSAGVYLELMAFAEGA